MAAELFHFSEVPAIEVFEPHIPATNPSEPPAVWAIDAEHAPLYWFPRECPRVAVWPRPEDDPTAFRRAFSTTAPRVHALELAWLDRMRTTTLHRYVFDSNGFRRWPAASGYWVCDETKRPLRVEPVGDLLAAHCAAGIELRLVPSLWPLIDLVMDGTWDFSVVRKANALPRR